MDKEGRELLRAGLIDEHSIGGGNGVSKTFDLEEGERIVGYYGYVPNPSEGFIRDLQFVIGRYE